MPSLVDGGLVLWGCWSVESWPDRTCVIALGWLVVAGVGVGWDWDVGWGSGAGAGGRSSIPAGGALYRDRVGSGLGKWRSDLFVLVGSCLCP